MPRLAAVVLASIVVLALASNVAFGQGYDQQVRGVARGIQEKLTAAGKKTVAVVDFTDLDGSVTWLGRFLAEEVSVALASEAKGFEVIERTQLKAILQEQKLGTSGVIDPQTARRVGQIAGADVITTGSLTPFGDSIRLSVKALDVSTARMIAAASTDIPKTKAIDELLAKDVGGASGVAKPAVPAAGQPVGAGPAFQNRWFRLSVRSLRKADEDPRRPERQVTMSLALENLTAQEAVVACDLALIDEKGIRWTRTGDQLGEDHGLSGRLNLDWERSATLLAPRTPGLATLQFHCVYGYGERPSDAPADVMDLSGKCLFGSAANPREFGVTIAGIRADRR